jgi:hypothetical protein
VRPTLPTISGSDLVCYDGSTFTLNNAPSGTITWSATGPFTVSGNGTTATVTRTGTDTSNGTLTANVNGTAVASKTITPCPAPTITGPTNVCTISTYTFTANNAPAGITWEASSNLTISGTGNSVTVSATANGAAWIKIKVNGATLDNQYIWVGLPVITALHGPTSVNTTGHYVVYIQSDQLAPPNCYWFLNGGTGSISSNIYALFPSTEVDITFHNSALYTVNVIASNACGTNYWGRASINVNASNSGYFSTYPNPASNILNVEINAQAPTTNAKQLTPNSTCDIRLYDNQGNLLRNAKTRGGSIQFNVASLPNGIYYLHIYDGVNASPEMRQIVVEH